jgi:anti-sigma B factor antagonist
MEIDAHIEKGNYRIALRGELDASSSILLDDSLRDGLTHNPRSIQVDCAGLRYISSAGLGVFISHLQELRAKAIPLVLFALRQPVANVFQVLGLDGLLPILPDQERAGLYCEAHLTGGESVPASWAS